MTRLEWDGNAVGAAGALELDAAKLYGFEHVAEIPEHAVEAGAPVSDHIRPVNPTCSIEGLITNTPVLVPTTQMEGVTRAPAVLTLGGGAQITVQQWSGPFDRVKACDALLAELATKGELLRVFTGLRIVEDLGITRYRAERSGGDAVAVTIELKRVRIVSTARATVPAVRRVQVRAQRGAQPVDDRSALARGLDGGSPVTAARERVRQRLRLLGGG
jgi:hypothetical protein